MFTLPAEPQRLGKVLDTGFKLFKVSFKESIIFGILLGVVVLVQMFVVPDPVINLGDPEAGGLPQMDFDLAKYFLLIFLFGIISYGIFVGLIYKYVAILSGDSITVGAAIAKGYKKLIPLIILAILYWILVVVGLFVLIIPGLYLMVSLMFGVYAIVMEDLGPIAALKKSHELVKGNWWRTTGFLTVIMVVYVAFFSPAVFVGSIVGTTSDSQSFMLIAVGAGYALTTALITPLRCTLFLVYYKDLILRKEGGDLAEKIAQS